MGIFKKAEPPVETPKPWPSALNPCTNETHRAQHKAPNYGVRGKVTKVCLYCYLESGKTDKERQAYLNTLNPNLEGCDSQSGHD